MPAIQRGGVQGDATGVRVTKLLVAVVAALALVSGGVIWNADSVSAPAARAAPAVAGLAASSATVTVGAATSRRIPTGFLGLSFEYWALENYAGKNPRAIDPVLVRLIRNLDPHRGTVMRIGGVTTDRSWWPVPGVTRPPGTGYTITHTRLEVARSLAHALGARLIMGVQFEADSTAEAAAESRAMMQTIGSRLIAGFELGNEPELYANRWFYKVNGQEVFGRPPSWQFGPFVRDYSRVADAMGSVPIAGPAIGSYSWMSNIEQFLNSERVSIVTLHRYPLQACGVGPGADNYPTFPHLLGQRASIGLATQFAPYVALVHAHHLQVRNAEMNSVSCGDAHGIADTFGSALWALDALYRMADIGVDGVNLHTYSGAAVALFTVKRPAPDWRLSVAPEYYGVLMFSQAAPAGSRLVRISTSGAGRNLRVWGTTGPGRQSHIVLINDSLTRAASVRINLPAAPARATVERLLAPSVRARGGVSLGGESFGALTSTGRLPGAMRQTPLQRRAGAYVVRVPAASAAMITLR